MENKAVAAACKNPQNPGLRGKALISNADRVISLVLLYSRQRQVVLCDSFVFTIIMYLLYLCFLLIICVCSLAMHKHGVVNPLFCFV